MATGQDERFADALTAFTNTLRQERIRVGLTQTELADRARLSVTMVQNLERPSYAANPRLSTLLALAEALDIDLAALLPAGTHQAPTRPRGSGMDTTPERAGPPSSSSARSGR